MERDDFDFGGLGDWGTGVFGGGTETAGGIGGLLNLLGEFGLGEFGSNLMVFDNQTGQIIPFSQAMQIDPSAAQSFISSQGYNLGNVGASLSGGPLSGAGGLIPNAPSPALTSWWDSMSTAQKTGLGIAGATAGVGLAGIIQKAMQGNTTARQEIQRAIGSGSPEEQQAIRSALSNFQTLNQFAMGSPTGLMQQLGARAPFEEAAFQSGLGGLANQGQLSNQLLQTLLPGLAGITPNFPQGGQGPGMPPPPPAPNIPMVGGTPGTPGTAATPGGYAAGPLAQLWGPGTGGYDYLTSLDPNTPISIQGNNWVGPGGRLVGDVSSSQNPSLAASRGIMPMAGTPGTSAIPGTPGTPDPNFAPQPYSYPGQGQYNWANNAWQWAPENASIGSEGPIIEMPKPGTPSTPWQLPGGTGQPSSGGLPSLLSGQEQILNQLLQATQGNMSPQLLRLIEQAFQPQLGNIATQAIEAARQRGFAGGAELLNQAPAGALAGPALADLQGQMAQAKLGLPAMLGQAAGAFSTPAALRLSGTSNLMNMNQNILQSLLGVGNQGIQNRLGFMGAATGQLGTQGNLGNVGRLNTGTTTSTMNQPFSLLDAFAPLAGLLGGAGGLLGGISGSNLSGWRQ